MGNLLRNRKARDEIIKTTFNQYYKKNRIFKRKVSSYLRAIKIELSFLSILVLFFFEYSPTKMLYSWFYIASLVHIIICIIIDLFYAFLGEVKKTSYFNILFVTFYNIKYLKPLYSLITYNDVINNIQEFINIANWGSFSLNIFLVYNFGIILLAYLQIQAHECLEDENNLKIIKYLDILLQIVIFIVSIYYAKNRIHLLILALCLKYSFLVGLFAEYIHKMGFYLEFRSIALSLFEFFVLGFFVFSAFKQSFLGFEYWGVIF